MGGRGGPKPLLFLLPQSSSPFPLPTSTTVRGKSTEGVILIGLLSTVSSLLSLAIHRQSQNPMVTILRNVITFRNPFSSNQFLVYE